MPVIGTFSEHDERAIGKDKMEYAEVRSMEISSVLQRESANGRKPVKQIEFKGERLDMSSVRRSVHHSEPASAGPTAAPSPFWPWQAPQTINCR